MKKNFYLNRGIILIDKKKKKNEWIYRFIACKKNFIELHLTFDEAISLDLLMKESNEDIQSVLILENKSLFLKLKNNKLLVNSKINNNERYSRNDLFLSLFESTKYKEIYENKNILIIGSGGIGSNMGHILARSGFNIIIVDNDVIEESNLVRQLFLEKDLNKKKVECIVNSFKKINSEGFYVGIDKKIEKIEDLLEIKNQYKIDFVIIAGDSSIKLQKKCYDVFSVNKIPVMGVGYAASFGLIGPIINNQNKKMEKFLIHSRDDITLEINNNYFINASLSFYVFYISSLASLEIYKYFSKSLKPLSLNKRLQFHISDLVIEKIKF